MFKTETHLHTSEVSECSSLSAREMVRVYKKLGYKTIFISDHLYPFLFDRLGDAPWEDKISIFLAGYYKARELGKELGINVLLSAEIEFRENNNHYLVYGIDKDFLISYPDLLDMGIEKFSRITRQNNIFLVQAHPHRDRGNTPKPEYVDALEVINPNPRHENYDDECIALAKAHNLYMTSGSDAHRMCDVGRAGVETDEEIKTADDYIRFVKSNKIKLIKDLGDKNDLFAE